MHGLTMPRKSHGGDVQCDYHIGGKGHYSRPQSNLIRSFRANAENAMEEVVPHLCRVPRGYTESEGGLHGRWVAGAPSDGVVGDRR